MTEELPKVITDWFNEVVEDCRKQPGKENKLDKIQIKLEHTARVVKWGKKIMDGEKWRWNYQQGLTVCLLHDIGRFPQALYGTFRDGASINHAKKGRIMFKEAGVDLSSFDGNSEEIAEAIGEHNNIFYQGDNPYVKLVRDADELTIMEELEEQILGKFFEKGTYQDSGEFTKELLEYFCENKPINTVKATTIADWLLCVRSWEKLLNYQTSRMLYIQEKFGDKIKNFYLRLYPGMEEEAKVFTIN